MITRETDGAVDPAVSNVTSEMCVQAALLRADRSTPAVRLAWPGLPLGLLASDHMIHYWATRVRPGLGATDIARPPRCHASLIAVNCTTGREALLFESLSLFRCYALKPAPLQNVIFKANISYKCTRKILVPM